jgi:hypothetical protein
MPAAAAWIFADQSGVAAQIAFDELLAGTMVMVYELDNGVAQKS